MEKDAGRGAGAVPERRADGGRTGARARAQYEASFVRGIERIGGFGGKSDRLAQSQVFRGSPDAYKISLKRIQKATAEDLKAAANRWLSDGVYVLEVHPFPQYKTAATGADRSKAPEIGDAAGVEAAEAAARHALERTEGDSGGASRSSAGEFLAGRGCGLRRRSVRYAGTASMTMALLNGGTKTRTALQISDEQALLGRADWARVRISILSIVRLSALKSKLDPSLELFADVILNPVFPGGGFQAAAEAAASPESNARRTTPVQMALRVFPAPALRRRPRVWEPADGFRHDGQRRENDARGSGEIPRHSGSSRTTRRWSSRAIRRWPKSRRSSRSCLPAGSRAQTPEKNIGAVQLPAKSDGVPDRQAGRAAVDDHRGQCCAANRPIRTRSRFEAMNDGLGGMFGSRINMNLREDKHWSYGAPALFCGRARRSGRSWPLAPVQTDKTKESLAEINKEFRGILARPSGDAGRACERFRPTRR